ncbi:Hpt domain-containing protein [Colwelliaceae bacterium 6441]
MSNTNQLDLILLEGYVENLGKDIVQQMLDLYIQQSVIYLQDIQQAISEASQPLWQDHCHKMKGAAGSVGLVVVHAKLVAIEKSTDSWTVKQAHFQELVDSNENAISLFKNWLADKQ